MSFAQTSKGQDITNKFFYRFNDEKITVSTVAIGFTQSKIHPGGAYEAELAEFSIETCQIRARITDSPTSTTGTLLPIGNIKLYNYYNIDNVTFIRDTSCSSDATINVSYYR